MGLIPMKVGRCFTLRSSTLFCDTGCERVHHTGPQVLSLFLAAPLAGMEVLARLRLSVLQPVL